MPPDVGWRWFQRQFTAVIVVCRIQHKLVRRRPQRRPFVTSSHRQCAQSGSATPYDPYDSLTTREREVLKMLAEGQSVKEIACDLNLSVKTVEAHKFNLMRKLDIHNKAQLVQYAIQKKIIKIPNIA